MVHAMFALPMEFLCRNLALYGSFSCFLLVVLTNSNILALPKVVGYETDQLALLEIKAKIVDSTGVLSSWNKTNNYCEWSGVTCGHRHQRVTMLNLQSSNLSGTISPHIGNLSFLREIHLQNNSFNYNIPSEVGCLFRLQKLFLHNNSFNGGIPSNLSHCSSLLYVNLGFNMLEGNLARELGSLSKLQVLILEVNGLTGTIPSSFGNLSSLQVFTTLRNHLSGRIPDSLGQLRNLKVLFLGVNNFVGTVPISIFNISSITGFDMAENQLEGYLPNNIGYTLPNIERIGLSDNHFTGSIPQSISNASNLAQIEIVLNNFTGEVPSFEKMRQLQWFSIDENQLGSQQQDDLNFLCSLTNSTRLEILSIEGNNFGGSMPECISNFSITLSSLAFSKNYISGSLPNGIGNLTNLDLLVMWGNNISGNIPSALGNLNKLQLMDLHFNMFSGQIPQSLGNLSALTKLILSRNNLQGLIPSSLGNCQNLLLLDLFNNNLSGPIPPEIFGLSSLSMYLDLSQNNLNGTISKEVGNLNHLSELYLYNNRLSGQIPNSIGGCASLQLLYLQENFFEGLLPSTLSFLRAIQVLNVSNNRLFGPIPKFLGSLNLTNLSLSYNDFEGALPTEGVFRSTNSTMVVGNKKLCGGLPEFQLPKCNFTKSHVTRTSGTRKLEIIFIISGLVVVACILLLFYVFWFKHNEKATTSSSLEDGLLKVSYHGLLKATNGFSSTNLVGTGNFGSVYKGLLSQTQMIVAIKILDLTRHGAFRSFIAECEALRRIRHRNLVKVLTACSGIDFSGNDFKALVYEFMSGGSLDEWLHLAPPENKAPRPLNLLDRVNIAIDVACALDYLHHHCETSIVHCDLKPSNVLLDDELVAHVGDFGLVRFFPEATHKLLIDHTSSIGVKGSFGYIAPEYGLGSKASTCGDVYSYGVLILEMFIGKRPTDAMFEDGLNLHFFAKAALADPIEKIIDPFLVQEVKELQISRSTSSTHKKNVEESLISIIEVGVICSSESPMDRMDISNVLSTLQEIKKKLTQR